MTTEVPPGAGARLAAAREARGMSVADVAAQLKLSPRQIEALEADNLAQLPGDVFVRGFIRNYARLLDLNPEELLPPVIASVPEEITAPSTNLRFRTAGVRHWLLWPLVLLLAFFALVAGLYAWLGGSDATMVTPDPGGAGQVGATADGASGDGAAPVNALLPPTPEVLDAPPEASQAPTGAPAPAVEAEVAPAPVPAPKAPMVPAMPVAPQSSLAPPVAASAQPSATVPAPTKLPAPALLFQPAEDAWIQVVDARGQRFTKLMAAGSSETFEGTPPFRLVVGNAQSVRLSYRGRAVDLKPFIGDKVARLSLDGEGVASAAGPASGAAVAGVSASAAPAMHSPHPASAR